MTLLSDTPPMALAAKQLKANAQWVQLGAVELLFYHRACIAANLPGIRKVRNETYVGYSTTTTRLLNEEGFCDRPALPGDTFSRLVALALSLDHSDFMRASQTLVDAWNEARALAGKST